MNNTNLTGDNFLNHSYLLFCAHFPVYTFIVEI